MLNHVQEADAQADLVVKTIHSHQGPGGSRNVPETPAFLVEFAHDCIDAGADVLMVTGPHLLRGIEIYDGKPIFYSLGQFFRQYDTMNLKPAESFDLFNGETILVRLIYRIRLEAPLAGRRPKGPSPAAQAPFPKSMYIDLTERSSQPVCLKGRG